jgi:hypothetical protein
LTPPFSSSSMSSSQGTVFMCARIDWCLMKTLFNFVLFVNIRCIYSVQLHHLIFFSLKLYMHLEKFMSWRYNPVLLIYFFRCWAKNWRFQILLVQAAWD